MLEPPFVGLKRLTAIAAGTITLWSLVSHSAQAATLTYEMTVDIEQGDYQGTHQGSFNYDDSQPLQTCQDDPTFTCATVKQNKLSVLFNFLGTAYSEKEDRDYRSGFPSVYFQKGTLAGLSLVVTPPTSDISFSILGKEFYMGFDVYPNSLTKQGLIGSVFYKLQQLTPTPAPAPYPPCPGSCGAVPEPSEIVGSAFAIALLGLGLKLKRNG